MMSKLPSDWRPAKPSGATPITVAGTAGKWYELNVTGFVAALIGSLLYSLCGLVIDVALERIFERRS